LNSLREFKAYIEYYHQKKHQGTGMSPNHAYQKYISQYVA